MKPEMKDLHLACAKIAQILTHYLPAIPDQRTEVYCLGAEITEGPGAGKRAASTWLKFKGKDGESMEFVTLPVFEDTDTPDHIIHVTVGSFLTEWHRYQKALETPNEAHP